MRTQEVAKQEAARRGGGAMRERRVLLTRVTDASRGWPITSSERHYLDIPLLNKPLLVHQEEILAPAEARVVTRRALVELLKEVPRNPFSFLPGDILLTGDSASLLRTSTSSTGGKEGIILYTLQEETEETRAVRHLFDNEGVAYAVVVVEGLRLNYPWEFLTANQHLARALEGQEVHPSVTIEEGVTLKGPLRIAEGTLLKSGTYIEGPVVIGKGCEIGPFAHLRPETAIGDHCRVGKTEVVDTILFPEVTSKHHAYLGHSILGVDVNVGAFTVTADYRHDGNEHLVWVKGEKVASGRRKVGAFIGDHARLAISTSIYPGRKIKPFGTTLPGEVVREDEE